jgi:hypothetical protein
MLDFRPNDYNIYSNETQNFYQKLNQRTAKFWESSECVSETHIESVCEFIYKPK